jgi:phosphotriesterase-related protein
LNSISRRHFFSLAMSPLFLSWKNYSGKVMTVTGPVDVKDLGITLTHEHVLVDFIGADKFSLLKWDRKEVLKKMLPYFLKAKKAGVQTVFECTPSFLGRDPELLRMLSEQSGILLVTNTGYYGAFNNKYLPQWTFTETAEQLAERWIDEFENGIEGTKIRPGFIKISVDAAEEGLSEVHKKIVAAAAIAHRRTGLTINSHTGPSHAAFEQLQILKNQNVAPNAFVWVHAQAEPDYSKLVEAAHMGAWVSLDNINADFDKYAERLTLLKRNKLLNRVLISHDSGYYQPDQPDGGKISGYTNIFTQFIPLLKTKGFSKTDIEQLLKINPAESMRIRIR